MTGTMCTGICMVLPQQSYKPLQAAMDKRRDLKKKSKNTAEHNVKYSKTPKIPTSSETRQSLWRRESCSLHKGDSCIQVHWQKSWLLSASVVGTLLPGETQTVLLMHPRGLLQLTVACCLSRKTDWYKLAFSSKHCVLYSGVNLSMF